MITSWLQEALGVAPTKLFDPACGPGSWLLPFAKQGCYTAGNDIRPAMIEAASALLTTHPHELTVGDMCDLSFQEKAFDAALNLDASIGHLSDDQAVLQHLRSVAKHLRIGGVYLLGAIVFDTHNDEEPQLLFTQPYQPIDDGGEARLRYTSLRRDAKARFERIQAEVWTRKNPKIPAYIKESYDLRTFPASLLQDLIHESGLSLHTLISVDHPNHRPNELYPDAGDLNLILQKI